MTNLKTMFDRLAADTSTHKFKAATVESLPDTYLAVDATGRPSFFRLAEGSSAEAPLRTAHVSLRLGTRFTITPASSNPVTAYFDCLSCEATDQAAIDTFLILIEAYVSNVLAHTEIDTSLSSFFRSVVRLFAVNASRDLASERQGLWGELFVMRSVNGYAYWVQYWHTEPNRRFDFSTDGKRVEVKTTVGGARIHHVAHRQVYALPGEEILVASLIVSPDDAGLALRQLIDECREAVAATPEYIRLERAVRRAGMDDPTEIGPSFDAREALLALAWFDANQVPHFRVPEPPGVSDTRYRVDLSTAPRMDSDAVQTWLRQWEAAHANT